MTRLLSERSSAPAQTLFLTAQRESDMNSQCKPTADRNHSADESFDYECRDCWNMVIIQGLNMFKQWAFVYKLMKHKATEANFRRIYTIQVPKHFILKKTLRVCQFRLAQTVNGRLHFLTSDPQLLWSRNQIYE